MATYHPVPWLTWHNVSSHQNVRCWGCWSLVPGSLSLVLEWWSLVVGSSSNFVETSSKTMLETQALWKIVKNQSNASSKIRWKRAFRRTFVKMSSTQTFFDKKDFHNFTTLLDNTFPTPTPTLQTLLKKICFLAGQALATQLDVTQPNTRRTPPFPPISMVSGTRILSPNSTFHEGGLVNSSNSTQCHTRQYKTPPFPLISMVSGTHTHFPKFQHWLRHSKLLTKKCFCDGHLPPNY